MKPSKKTITTLNRSTTYIPTSWVKIPFILFFVFVLLSCEEDYFSLGFKKPSPFTVNYVEFPIETTVLSMDSLLTQNMGFSQETQRILVGKYDDSEFGTVKAESFFNISPNILNVAVRPTALCDSVILQLRFDFYSYGSSGSTEQTFKVHEIIDELDLDKSYYFNSNVNYDAAEIGSATFNVDKDYFKLEYDDTDTDSVLTLKIKLNIFYGQRLLDAVDPEDENYTNFSLFKKIFKGLSITSGDSSDKIVGFKPDDENNYMTLYYHDNTDTLALSYSISNGINFSKFYADRSATELAGLTQHYTEYDPGQRRFIQSGTSVVTKLDFTKFYEYFDTINNPVFNSVELEISDVQGDATFTPPSFYAMGMIDEDNVFKKIETAQDTVDFIDFQYYITQGDKSGDIAYLFAADDGRSLFTLEYSDIDQKINGFPTLFFQQLFFLKDRRFPHWILRPTLPQAGKSTDRVIFSKDKIKLKIYYTLPNITDN